MKLKSVYQWNQKMIYPSDVEEEDIHDTQNGRGEPNGEEGDERESNTPNEGQWQG